MGDDEEPCEREYPRSGLLYRGRLFLDKAKSEQFSMRYAVVIEKAPTNYAAYVPDLPGCIATGASVVETESLIREAIEFHLEGLKADGLPIPLPSSHVEYVDVPA